MERAQQRIGGNFRIMTTAAHATMRQLHKRMPVIFEPDVLSLSGRIKAPVFWAMVARRILYQPP